MIETINLFSNIIDVDIEDRSPAKKLILPQTIYYCPSHNFKSYSGDLKRYHIVYNIASLLE